jgi:hypothetical protein
VRSNKLFKRNSGFYSVGNKVFNTKIQACIYATESKQDLKFIYFDFAWKNSDKTIHANLKDLYKLRAEQLRDENDYLILNYSGGTDSWTILNTYLTHNIFLDEVVIKWPLKAIYDGNRNIHTPNLNNKHPSNYLTEWEAFMLDDIKMIEKLSPKTKITIYDFSDKLFNIDEKTIYDLPSNHFISLPSIVRMGSQTDSEIKLDDNKVASIYGVDKPLLCRRGNDCFFRFNDKAAQVSGNNVVYFFWAPDMPVLLIEMAHRVFEWFQEHKDKQYLIQNLDNRFNDSNFKEYIKIVNNICCPDYDYSRFQIDKPTSVLYNEKDFWCNMIPEYQSAFKHWNAILNERFSEIDNKFLYINNDVIHELVTKHSITYKLGSFT